MQKFIVLLIGLSLVFSVNAQKHFPSPSENPFWTEAHEMIWSCSTGGCSGYYCKCTTPIYYKSDTIINGITYNRLYSYGICQGLYTGGAPPQGCPFLYNYRNAESVFATIRQDTANNIVYILDNNAETILYDFNNITVGKAYPETYSTLLQSDSLMVISEDSILMGNQYFMKWDLGVMHNGTIENPGFVSIIEGIGSTYGITAQLIPPFENEDELLCFSLNNTIFYPDSSYDCDKTVDVPEFTSKPEFYVYPNPAFSHLTLETAQDPDEKYFLKIVSSTGLVILEKQICNKTTLIDISNFNNGLYLIQCNNRSTFESIKFIKN